MKKSSPKSIFIKMAAVIMVAIIFVCLVAGCTDSGKVPASNGSNASNADTQKEMDKSGDALRRVSVSLAADPESFAPWLGATTGGRAHVQPLIYEPLFMLETIGGDMNPCIASKYEKLDDFTYRISLNDNVYDSAGNHITANDVVFSYKTAKDLGNAATFLNAYENIEYVDDYTVKLTLNSKEVGGLLNTTTMIYIVSEKAYKADPDGFASKPVGTGPYVLKNWTPGATTVLVKNEKYWQAGNPQNAFAYQNCDEIEYHVYTETSQVPIAFETGEIDASANVATSDLYLFEDGGKNKGFKIYNRPAALSQVILFNSSPDSACQDQKLRQAICYAIDNQALIDGAYDGRGSVCKTYGNASYGDYLEKWDNEDYYDYNVEKAKECLAASNYNNETLTIMVGNAIPAHVRMAQIVQSYLAEAGINAKIANYDDALYQSYRFDSTQWDIQITNKGSGDYLANVWKYNFDQRLFGGKTQSLSPDEELQVLLEKCLDESTHNAEAMDAFHQYLKEKVYGYGLLYSFDYFVYVDTIDKLVVNSQNAIIAGSCEYSANFAGH